MPEQLVRYFWDIASGDLGRSLVTGQLCRPGSDRAFPGFVRADAGRDDRRASGFHSAWHRCGDPRGLVDRSPRALHRHDRRFDAGLRRRHCPDLCFLLQARARARADRPHRSLHAQAADGDRLDAARQPDRRQFRGLLVGRRPPDAAGLDHGGHRDRAADAHDPRIDDRGARRAISFAPRGPPA